MSDRITLETLDAQWRIGKWARETFGTHTLPTTPEQHKRDVVAVARHLRREATKLDDLADDTNAPYLESELAELGYELADIVILALQAGHLLDIDVGDYVEAKMSINMHERTWGTRDRSGVAEHRKVDADAFLRAMRRQQTDADRKLFRSLMPADWCARCDDTGVGYDGRACMYCRRGTGELARAHPIE
jgi:hypothetical protein